MQPKDYSILIFEINEFLNRRTVDQKQLTNREIRMLEFGINLLEQALTGHDLLGKRRLIPDIESIDAYSFASKAASAMSHDVSADRDRNKQLFETTIQILKQIRSGTALSSLDPDAVKKTQDLFEKLSLIALSTPINDVDSGPTDPDDIFSRIIHT